MASSRVERPKRDTFLGAFVFDQRNQRKWSTRKLAQRTGCSASLVSEIENGVQRKPKFETISRLSAALGISIIEFQKVIDKDIGVLTYTGEKK